MTSAAAITLLSHQAVAQTAPPGAVLDLGTGTPPTVGQYTQYSVTVTPQNTGAYYTLFAFREDPAYFRLDDTSLTAVGSTTNLLTNPGFEGNTTPNTLNPGNLVPDGWGVVYQNGNVPSASGRVDGGVYGGTGLVTHSGNYVWDDGSVGHFDGLYQTVSVTAGQRYLLSFFLSADDEYLTGTDDSQNQGVEMAVYFGACDALDSSCSTALGSGFTVQQPSTPSTAIDLVNGNIAPNIFSLASAAANAATLDFEGGTLRLTGGDFPGNIIPVPVSISSLNGTVDTSLEGGAFTGVVSGPGSLTIIGSNTFLMSGANTYAGGTFLNGGTLAVGNSSALGTGTLTFGGGNLQAAADGLTLANAAVLSSDATIDTQTFTLGYAGAISGPGALTKIGDGTLVLSADNTNTGLTTVGAGTLKAGSATGFSSASAFFVDTAGILDVAGFNASVGSLSGTGRVINSGATTATLSAGQDGASTAFSGVLADGAAPLALTKVGFGTLTLSGNNTYSGGTVLFDGTLAVGSDTALGTGQLAMNANTTLAFAADGLTIANPIVFTGVSDPTIDSGSGTQTISGPITGPGALTKTGSGTLDLTGTNAFTGATEVAAGRLLVDGSITSVVTVDNGASLGGSGSISGFVANAGSTVGAGANRLTVTGNASFLTGSTYQVTVNPDGTGTRLAIGGTASLGGAGLSVLAGPGTFGAKTYTLLTAEGGVSGTFGTTTIASTLALLSPTLGYTANDVTLTLHPVDFRTIATTPNTVGVAGAIQNLGPGAALYDAVVGLDNAGARQAFASASGVSHASAPGMIATMTRLTTGLVIDRLWDVSGNGLSAQQVLDQFAPDRLPALVRCYGPVPEPVTPPPAQSYTAWGEAFGSFGHSDGGANAGSLDRSLGGFVLGLDTPLQTFGLDKWRAGIAGGYTNTSYTSHLDGGTGTVQGVFGSLYGGARYGSIDLRVGTTVGGNFVDARRTVAFPGFLENERSSNTGYSVQTFGEIGYRLTSQGVVIEPVAGLAYLHSHLDGFSEKGGAAALTVSAVDNDLGTTSLGFRTEAQPFRDLPVVAHAFLAWQHVLGNIAPSTTLAFEAAPANTFTVAGAPIDRDAMAAEVAVDYRVSKALDVGLSYSGLIGPTAADHSVKGRVEYRF